MTISNSPPPMRPVPMAFVFMRTPATIAMIPTIREMKKAVLSKLSLAVS